jgi:hypothetical protein
MEGLRMRWLCDDAKENRQDELNPSAAMKSVHKLRWLAATIAVCTSTVMADVTLDFNYAETILNGLQPLTLDCSIGGSGIVSLNASTANTNASFITAVDAWDAANLGSVSEASLFGTLFTMTGGTSGRGLALANNDTGVLGISGQAAARVDLNGAKSLAFREWQFCTAHRFWA